MSTPPEQPPEQLGGYGTPVPPQHNPYAQPIPGPNPGPDPGLNPGPNPNPSPYAPSSGYYVPAPPTAAPGGGGSGGGAGRAVLWAVVGAAVASALWGGGVLLLGKDSDSAKADLRGYTVKSDLCTSADLAAFQTAYPQPDSDPTTFSAPGQALDTMSCNESLKKTGSTYSDAYLSIQMDLHKKSDPAPEFADTWLSYKKRANTYIVSTVEGIGDEAYLVTEDTVTPSTTGGSSSGDREVILAVRDGWMTYSMSWSAYASSLDSSSDAVATVSEATAWVKAATKATLTKLKP